MFISINGMLIFLAIFIGSCLIITVSVLLIIALVRLIKAIRKVNKILDDNAENIRKAVNKLPDLTENIDRTVTSAGETLIGLNDTFFDSKSTNDTVSTVVSIVESVANLATNLFTKHK